MITRRSPIPAVSPVLPPSSFSPWRLVAVVLIAALAPVLGGCTGLLVPSGDPPARLQLNPPSPPVSGGTPVSRATPMVVTMPRAGRDIDTDRIALLFGGREVRSLKGYRWSNTAPALVEQALIDGLQASGAFASVTDEIVGVNARYRLMCDLQQFTLRYDDAPPDGRATTPPTAVVQGVFRLFDQQTASVVSTLPVRIEEPAQATEVPALIAAQETALGRAVAEVAAWSAAAIPIGSQRR